MESVKKILRFGTVAALIFGPLGFAAYKLTPLIKETIQITASVPEKSAERQQERLDALALISENATPPETTEASVEVLSEGLSEVTTERPVTPPDNRETVVIDENSPFDDEAKIQAMMIPESTKQEILRNYRRTGYLPDFPAPTQGQRRPASVE